jgi:hypothetical protein
VIRRAFSPRNRRKPTSLRGQMRLLDRCHAQAIDEDRTRERRAQKAEAARACLDSVPACTVGAL